MAQLKIAIVASDTAPAETAKAELAARYETCSPAEADVIVALGGDGYMLQTLHGYLGQQVPIYGMNQGSVGFLMNAYSTDDLIERIQAAQHTPLHPLLMRAQTATGGVVEGLAINEVSLLRQTRYAAKLTIAVDGRERLAELICDGAMLATPAGSTAYNLSAHGPILPLGSNLLALTPICAFRPRQWPGALLPETVSVRFDVLEPDLRPVSASADYTEARDVVRVDVERDTSKTLELLFDPEHNLEERIIREQFMP